VAKGKDRIDRVGLDELFKTIDYRVTPEQFNEMA